MDGYSAQREGVRIGDEILSINGVELLHGPLDTLREFTRGEPLSTLQMIVLRHGAEQPMTFTLTRENIRVRAVSYSGLVADGIGYIRLERFSASAGEEIREAIAGLRKEATLRGIILDLRDNPGGLLESAVEVSSRFLPAGSTVVTTRGRDSSSGKVYYSTEPPMAGDVPLVVMVNGGSASAAEIVAGAIQDLDAGLILGTRSFGKGLVQSVRRLSHDATLKMTTARYYTPSGRCIQSTIYGKEAARQAALDHEPFRTRNGRTVLQGGGILPDTIVAGLDSMAIVERLRRSALLFKYATRYAAALRSLPEGFMVDDRMMADFERFVSENAAAAAPAGSALAHLRELRDQALREKSSRDVIQHIDQLRAELVSQIKAEITRSREDIRHELANEIRGRFQGQRQRLEASLHDDSQLQTAVTLLRAGRRDYNRLLSAK
jgi:carboxyl-terminal processing protease